MLDFKELSRGTRKLLVLMPSIVEVLMRGKTLVVDVAEANLHTKVFSALIGLFTDKTTNCFGAQWVFTSHNVTIMTRERFRRDEIWFG